MSYRNSELYRLFNLKDEKAHGRTIMLVTAMLSGAVSWLTGGLFYTSFLTENGIDLVKIGIVSSVPFIASCFSVFSPSILERIEKRRWPLFAARFTYYTLNILGVTVMPRLVHDESTKLALFLIIILAANIINALFSSGYTVWHLNFIPDDVRAAYFTISSTASSFVGIGTGFVSAIIADSFASSPHAYTIILVLRYTAYILGAFECWLYTRPVEYPYRHLGVKVRLSDIIRRPLSSRKFMYTMGIMALWAFFTNTANASRNYYLLNSIGMKHTYYMLMNFTYTFFQLALMKYTRRVIARFGWLKTFAVSALVYSIPIFACSFVNAANYLWLYTAVRFSQHAAGMFMNTSYSNVLYINMPEEDRTNYMAFYTLAVNIFSLLGTEAGTLFVGLFPNMNLNFFGAGLCNVQVLMWIETLGYLIVPALVLMNLKKLSPES